MPPPFASSREVRCGELDEGWLAAQPGAKVLSLDCFDTLFWRRVAAPTDVFFELAQGEAYRSRCLSAGLRARAEDQARKLKWVRASTFEVTLEEIYRHLLPDASADEIAELIAVEIECEIAHGFIFEPDFRMIGLARQRGLKVIIVSDIYFSEAQLKSLLEGVMPGMTDAIDRVFCSSTFGRGKSTGIWKSVCERMQVKPDQIIHVGDNPHADLRGALSAGVRGWHLVRHEPAVEEVLQQRTQVGLQLFPELRALAALPSLFHGQLAGPVPENLAERMGEVTLGPILYAFAVFISEGLEALRLDGRPTRAAFLLRDGHLPASVCRVLLGEDQVAELNISRLAAISATIDSPKRVEELLSGGLSADGFEALLRQLLVPKEEASRVLAHVRASRTPERDFVKIVTRPEMVKQTVARSRAYRQRLYRHIVARTGLQRGDRLVFVDLGYSGTAQNLLAPFLREELDVDLQGIYLLAGEVMPGLSPRRGLIDPSWVDPRLIGSLTGFYIAAFEMMCARRGPSTIDFSEDGEPVFSGEAMAESQLTTVDVIQRACVGFVERLSRLPAAHRPRQDPRILGQSAAIELARLLYFPSRWEIDCLRGFEFDVNLGSSLKMSLLDVGRSERDMRRQGFLFMNAELEQRRTNYPMELRYLDLSLSTLMFGQNRLGFPVIPATSSFRREPLQVAVVRGDEQAVQTVEAISTFDGFYAVTLPCIPGAHVALLFGARFSCVQIEAVEYLAPDPNAVMRVARELEADRDYILDRGETVSGKVFQFVPEGMLVLAMADGESPQSMIRVVFRPLAMRE